MIKSTDIPDLVGAYLPTQAAHQPIPSQQPNVFECMRQLADHTKSLVADGSYRRARKCFLLTEKLYREGDNLVRLAIENVYIHSFSSLLDCHHPDKQVAAMKIPQTLYHIYVKQILASGI